MRGQGIKETLFVCVENAGRSQMAEAFARYYGEGRVEALSAGTMPSSEVNPTVIERALNMFNQKEGCMH
jgi:protein-tyrosine-phosphatase